jgi:hypothetical protein
MSPILFLEYKKFSSWTRIYQNICSLLICGDILENHFFFMYLIMDNIMLDLNVVRSVMEHWYSLKASYCSDHYNISWSIAALMFPSSS